MSRGKAVKNRVFDALDGVPEPFHGGADKAVVTGYKVGGHARKWIAGCKPAGEKWVAKQKRRFNIGKKRKNLI